MIWDFSWSLNLLMRAALSSQTCSSLMAGFLTQFPTFTFSLFLEIEPYSGCRHALLDSATVSSGTGLQESILLHAILTT